jgi:hypothetical protein
MSKWGDEGSTSPFMARLLMGMLNLRDTVFADIGKRKEFDVLYQFVFETTVSTRAASKQITQLLNEHSRKVSNGEIAHLRGAMIRLDEDIHSDLQRFFGEFLNSAVRVIKDGMQKLTMFLGLDIGLLYKRQGAYEKGIAEIAITRPELSAYLEEIRKWSEELIALRNRLHEGWTLPKITYKANRGTIYAVEPEISGRRISVFVGYILDRLCCFLEELTAYCLQNQMPAGISITEIPLHDRKPEYPARFHVTLTHGGSPIWRISYHNSAFEET